jgi:FeS assembly SUF system regulator
MLRVTKMTDYASMLLACLAQHPGRVHSASELAELSRLELPTVSKVLKPLSRAGLIEAFRGSQGGYRLARPASAITLFDVVEAIEGRLEMTECSGEHSLCELEHHCGIQGHWQKINDVIGNALKSASIAEMGPARRKSIPLKLAKA